MEMQVLAWDRKQKTTKTDGNVGFGMGQETENDRDMEMQVLAWGRKQKTTETDGNVGFGMGQEIENDRDGWKCRFWHGTGNRKRQRLMEMQVLAWDRKQKTTETDGNVGFGMGQETENDKD